MEEKNKVILVITVLTIVSLSLFYLFSPKFSKNGSYYEQIKINYKEKNDYLKIYENFNLNIKNHWNVVYRSFVEPICFNNNCNFKILDVNCKEGIPYISLPDGSLYMKKGNWKKFSKYNLKYSYKIQKNEVGCYNGNGYFGKEENLEVVYLTPLKHVEKNKYLHAFFTKEHLPIKELEVNGLNGNDKKERIAKDVPIFIDVKNGKIKVKDYTLLGYLIILGFNLFILLIWWFFGKDKEFIVPKYLHRKPINPLTGKEEDYITYALIYNTNTTPDKNIVAALLLSLKTKEILKEIKKEGVFTKKFTFVFDKEKLKKEKTNLNKYELKFLNFILNNFEKKESENEIIIEISSTYYNKRKMYEFFTSNFGKELNERFEKTALIITFLVLLFGGLLLFFLGNKLNIGLKKILMISYGIIFFTTIFEIIFLRKEFIRFKKEYYKEFLEIEAFRNFLNDYAQLKKYFPEDEVIWKDWLIIATALGVADNVLKVLKEKGYNLQELMDYEEVRNTSIAFATYVALSSPSSSSSGGGIGAGGGFGGGGGGGR